MSKIRASLVDHFNSKIDKSRGPCWLWTGQLSSTGYAVFFYGRKRCRAHRLSYKLCYGDFDEKLLVCHTCDVRNCVNPLHLFLGTQVDNMQDMIKKGRRSTKVRAKSLPQPEIEAFIIRSLSRKLTFKQIACLYGVSVTTIYVYCKAYGIEIKNSRGPYRKKKK